MKELIELKSLADKINQSHSEVNEFHSKSLHKAKETGNYIIQLYSMIPYNDRGKQLRKYCPSIKERTSQLYVQIAENWDYILPRIEEFKELSLRKAIKQIQVGTQTATPLRFDRSKVDRSKVDRSKVVETQPVKSIKSDNPIELKKSEYEEIRVKEPSKSDSNIPLPSPQPHDCSKCPRLINSFRSNDSLKDEIEGLKSYLSKIKSIIGDEFIHVEEELKRRNGKSDEILDD